MPSRASNAVLMVDSRADRDIGFPWSDFAGADEGFVGIWGGRVKAHWHVVPARAKRDSSSLRKQGPNHQCWLFTEGVRPIARPVGRGGGPCFRRDDEIQIQLSCLALPKTRSDHR